MSQALVGLQRFAALGELPRPESSEAAQALVDEARRQGLAPLLDGALAAAGVRWPAEAADGLRKQHRLALARCLRLLEAARRARALLAVSGLRTLPMKGVALAGLAYDSPADRPMIDADLLLLDGWDEAVAVLTAAGLTVQERAQHAWAFLDPDAGVTLELHRGLSACPGLFPIDASGLWRRRAGERLAERPGAEDLLVQLAVHAAFQHGLCLSLVQYLDFRRLFERAPVNAAALEDAARASRASACLLAALEAARSLVQAPVPEDLIDRLRRHASASLLRKLDAARRDPLALLAQTETPAALARWRLALAPSRLELLRHSVLPAPGGTALERTRLGLRRGLSLLRALV